MSQKNAQTEKLLAEGTARLLARATKSHALDVEAVLPRVRAAVEKYLLAAEPEASSRAIQEFIAGLHADDLCLIIACERGDQTAWSELVERFDTTVRSAARQAAPNEDAAEDLAQSIWAELHGLRARADGRPAGKLAYYSGRGSLGGWLRAVVAQLAIDQHRKTSRLVQTEEDADFDRLARDSHQGEAAFSATSAAPDPESALSETRAARDVEAALSMALGELGAEDRLLVKLYYFDDLRLREAGLVLGIHEATASRRLARIQASVRQRVEALLIKERGWTRAEAGRTLAEVASRLGSDLELMLTTERAAIEQRPQQNE